MIATAVETSLLKAGTLCLSSSLRHVHMRCDVTILGGFVDLLSDHARGTLYFLVATPQGPILLSTKEKNSESDVLLVTAQHTKALHGHMALAPDGGTFRHEWPPRGPSIVYRRLADHEVYRTLSGQRNATANVLWALQHAGQVITSSKA